MMAPSAIITSNTASNVDAANNQRESSSVTLLSRRLTKSATVSKSEGTTTTNNNDDKVHVRIVPSIENPSRSLIFDIVDRELEIGSVIKIGRYSERHSNDINCMSFKSKVVSRCHCELSIEADKKLYIRDTKSSSGTFLNHVRLSPAGNESKQIELHDGDIVQLGVDFQGGKEEIYRSVKMKFELNRPKRLLSFNLTAFQSLRHLTNQEEKERKNDDDDNQLEECCICLYALSPFQALFVSPCSHIYHYKCIRPLLKSHPGFQCPICRTYSDLDANVAIEEDIAQPTKNSSLDSERALVSSSLIENDRHSSNVEQPVSLSSNMILNTEPSLMEQPFTLSNPNNSNLDTEIARVETNHFPLIEEQEQHQPSSHKRERRSSHIIEKLKTVFFEKRKSTSLSQQQRRRHKSNNTNTDTHQQRPLSFSEGLFSSTTTSNIATSTAINNNNNNNRRRGSHPYQDTSLSSFIRTLSRQSTTSPQLVTIDEQQQQQQPQRLVSEPMMVDS
ncbi:uncharacterized protein BX663DRAFT_476034 [Cokeromyces recurvatus]|uniref:uncharacterized protein n=1 Tax=Cokeromyces recurvatus TaxID=90255 RepID=UPI0022210D07|nr:uncharacterized protein BX663DRAFT_476034 [Cokeromyces recurvatus]KAI7901002.1 hypothetical protein BX663DRAFT_476034 [Cokeromyces recurvatus]